MSVPGGGNARRQKQRSSNIRGTIVAVPQFLSVEQEPSSRLPQQDPVALEVQSSSALLHTSVPGRGVAPGQAPPRPGAGGCSPPPPPPLQPSHGKENRKE